MAVARKGEVRALVLPQVRGSADYLPSFQVQKNVVESGVIPLVRNE